MGMGCRQRGGASAGMQRFSGPEGTCNHFPRYAFNQAMSPRLITTFTLAAALILAGCATAPEGGPARSAAKPPQPTLTAGASWFQGSVTTLAKVEAAQPPGARNGNSDRAPADGGREGSRGGGGAGGGGGGMRMGKGGGGGGGGMRGGGGGGGGRGEEGGRPAGGEGRPGRSPTLTPPRQMLQLALTNRGTAPVEVSVTDFQSVYGNFAVRPDQLTLAPGETATVNPMFAAYPENLDEADLTVALRVAGKTERQTIRLTRAAP